ncbi:hypothetical protein JG688_00009432 [Phytophthora aleatoria]|uniref:Uncharacterized protein n=1 Tax=Phytophthora aleatoria TaxID=2496075 RepID=A0A8J5IG84_9STRA|nr:hypothetical protein JG688_00009432 [Phytophthora aleatoria]
MKIVLCFLAFSAVVAQPDTTSDSSGDSASTTTSWSSGSSGTGSYNDAGYSGGSNWGSWGSVGGSGSDRDWDSDTGWDPSKELWHFRPSWNWDSPYPPEGTMYVENWGTPPTREIPSRRSFYFGANQSVSLVGATAEGGRADCGWRDWCVHLTFHSSYGVLSDFDAFVLDRYDSAERLYGDGFWYARDGNDEPPRVFAPLVLGGFSPEERATLGNVSSWKVEEMARRFNETRTTTWTLYPESDEMDVILSFKQLYTLLPGYPGGNISDSELNRDIINEWGAGDQVLLRVVAKREGSGATSVMMPRVLNFTGSQLFQVEYYSSLEYPQDDKNLTAAANAMTLDVVFGRRRYGSGLPWNPARPSDACDACNQQVMNHPMIARCLHGHVPENIFQDIYEQTANEQMAWDGGEWEGMGPTNSSYNVDDVVDACFDLFSEPEPQFTVEISIRNASVVPNILDVFVVGDDPTDSSSSNMTWVARDSELRFRLSPLNLSTFEYVPPPPYVNLTWNEDIPEYPDPHWNGSDSGIWSICSQCEESYRACDNSISCKIGVRAYLQEALSLSRFEPYEFSNDMDGYGRILWGVDVGPQIRQAASFFTAEGYDLFMNLMTCLSKSACELDLSRHVYSYSRVEYITAEPTLLKIIPAESTFVVSTTNVTTGELESILMKYRGKEHVFEWNGAYMGDLNQLQEFIVNVTSEYNADESLWTRNPSGTSWVEVWVVDQYADSRTISVTFNSYFIESEPPQFKSVSSGEYNEQKSSGWKAIVGAYRNQKDEGLWDDYPMVTWRKFSNWMNDLVAPLVPVTMKVVGHFAVALPIGKSIVASLDDYRLDLTPQSTSIHDIESWLRSTMNYESEVEVQASVNDTFVRYDIAYYPAVTEIPFFYLKDDKTLYFGVEGPMTFASFQLSSNLVRYGQVVSADLLNYWFGFSSDSRTLFYYSGDIFSGSQICYGCPECLEAVTRCRNDMDCAVSAKDVLVPLLRNATLPLLTDALNGGLTRVKLDLSSALLSLKNKAFVSREGWLAFAHMLRAMSSCGCEVGFGQWSYQQEFLEPTRLHNDSEYVELRVRLYSTTQLDMWLNGNVFSYSSDGSSSPMESANKFSGWLKTQLDPSYLSVEVMDITVDDVSGSAIITMHMYGPFDEASNSRPLVNPTWIPTFAAKSNPPGEVIVTPWKITLQSVNRYPPFDRLLDLLEYGVVSDDTPTSNSTTTGGSYSGDACGLCATQRQACFDELECSTALRNHLLPRLDAMGSTGGPDGGYYFNMSDQILEDVFMMMQKLEAKQKLLALLTCSATKWTSAGTSCIQSLTGTNYPGVAAYLEITQARSVFPINKGKGTNVYSLAGIPHYYSDDGNPSELTDFMENRVLGGYESSGVKVEVTSDWSSGTYTVIYEGLTATSVPFIEYTNTVSSTMQFIFRCSDPDLPSKFNPWRKWLDPSNA